ncbi:MAG: CT583 family protein [Methylococcales bacterium]|nr:CT583 family protein [Methylococcales bacterium]
MNTKDLALAFLQKSQSVTSLRQPPTVINAFDALFSVQELNGSENQAIETLLEAGIELGSSCETRKEDLDEIKRLTKELRAIRRQELVLIGERVAAAREVFKKYKDRSFREWLQLTFGSFKTGYNYLSFYDLYISVPDEVKISLKDMPAKAVYVLASHKASLEKKIEVVRNNSYKTANGLITFIKESLGVSKIYRKITNEKILSSLEKEAFLLSLEQLDSSQRKRLTSIINHLSELVELSKKHTNSR